MFYEIDNTWKELEEREKSMKNSIMIFFFLQNRK